MSSIEQKKLAMGTDSSPWQQIGKLLAIREVNVLLALVLIGALISLFTPYFLTTNNIMGCSDRFRRRPS